MLTAENYDEMENGPKRWVLRARKPTIELAEKLFQ